MPGVFAAIIAAVLAALAPAGPPPRPAPPPARPAPPAASQAPPAAGPVNRMEGGGVSAPLGLWTDCSGRQALPRRAVYLWACFSDRVYFVGHNPGLFHPLLNDPVGTVMTWWDDHGQAHRYRVIRIHDQQRSAGVPPLAPGAAAQFQTCVTSDGSIDRIFDAAPA